MDEDTEGWEDLTSPKGKVTRQRSGIAFAYEDLSAALKLVHTAHHTYGGDCSADQLAGALGAKATSGSFRLKVGAGRLFGVLGGTGSQITVTTLGVNALDETNTGARSDAFLNVPLYKALYDEFSSGKTLPDDEGLEARIRALGVPDKQVTVARQVFARSADQAGFFAHGRSRLVLPPRGKVGSHTDGAGGGNDGSGKRSQEGTGIMSHPLIQGLLAALPEPGEDFPAEDRELWLQTLDMNLSVIYGRVAKTTQPKTMTDEFAERVHR